MRPLAVLQTFHRLDVEHCHAMGIIQRVIMTSISYSCWAVCGVARNSYSRRIDGFVRFEK